MKALIVSGGQEPSEKLLKKEIGESNKIICADSGANVLFKYGFVPDIVVGDLDSIDKECLEYFYYKNCEFIKYSKYKDYTDTQLAVNAAVNLEVTEITLLGCTGFRLDHFLGNLGILSYCLSLGIYAKIIDDYNEISIYEKSTTIYGNIGDVFSIQAYNDVVNSLTIYGARYPLNNYNLTLGDSRTISNVFNEKTVNLHFKSGRILVIKGTDK